MSILSVDFVIEIYSIFKEAINKFKQYIGCPIINNCKSKIDKIKFEW